ncbi:cytosol aminopeptidase family, catalytic domain-containing protein [Gorgonomyces haynaldii]|nr:cytosol aminopeptidase family, catalytic domain-containing protein [Gorgonomyces haynaldii]
MTTVAFKQATTGVRTRLWIGPKGSWDKIQLPFNKSQLSPFQLEKAPSSVSWWQENTLFIAAEYENKLSRNLGLVRADLVQDLANQHVTSEGDAHITLIVKNKEEAFIAGLGVSRNWPLFDRKSSEKKPRTVYVDFLVENGEQVNVDELSIVTGAVRNCQKMVDTPCSELNTQIYVELAQKLVQDLKQQGAPVEIKIIQGQELKEQGFGGIYGVGKGASFPPALCVLSYLPQKYNKTLALVGKGIVYDTGGLSLKPTASMCTMKSDMGGSAAVFNAFEAIVKSRLNVKTHALLCLAENAIGKDAFKNDDILYMYSGKTVEINNTDAEGRLVLADGVSYASKHLQPDVVLDIATLTGAQLITTGIKHAGVLTPSEDTEQRLIQAGKTSGELVFPLLYAPEILKSQFDSQVADMKNSVKDRMNAQSSCAGHFVESHLDKDYKGEWVHVDIAGPSFIKERGTGFGVGLLYALAKSHQ